jgi:hypothetical protein
MPIFLDRGPKPLSIVGVEDGSFNLRGPGKTTLLVSVLMRSGIIEDMRARDIVIDGLDATKKLDEMLRTLDFDLIMLAGVSYAGFNLIDPISLYETFRKPIIIISRRRPNNIAVKEALRRHFKDWKIRWTIVEKLGPIYEVESMPGETKIYVELIGIDLDAAIITIRETAICCRIPEPIRVARLIARGLTKQRRRHKI